MAPACSSTRPAPSRPATTCAWSIRELSRLTRDLLVVKLDPSRLNDPEIAAECERDRIKALAALFSNEDLMRAFDVLTKAELDIRASTQPRYHLELALLRWIHLRRLVPLSDLIEGLDKGGGARPAAAARPAPPPVPTTTRPQPAAPARQAAPPVAAARPAAPSAKPPAPAPASAPAPAPASPTGSASGQALKDALLNEIQKTKKLFYGTVIAQAQRIDGRRRHGDADVRRRSTASSSSSSSRTGPGSKSSPRGWRDVRSLSRASTATARRPRKPPTPARGGGQAAPDADRQSALKQKAMADSGVQAMLDVFGADIKDVKEI